MTKPQLSACAQAARLSALRSRNGSQVAQRLNINQSPTLKPFTSAERAGQPLKSQEWRA